MIAASDNSDVFFQGNQFSDRLKAIAFIKHQYGQLFNKKLVNVKKYRNGSSIFLKCSHEQCRFVITCKKRKGFLNDSCYFFFEKENSCLEHVIVDPTTNQDMGICGSSRQVSTVSSVYY